MKVEIRFIRGGEPNMEQTQSIKGYSKFDWLRKNIDLWVPKLILSLLQILIALGLFYFMANTVFPGVAARDVNIFFNLLGGLIASISAYLILVKYQGMVQQFSKENVNLGEQLGARTIELLLANNEMRNEIEERKRIEEALLESETRFKGIFQEAALGICLLNPDGRFLECNQAFQEMTGYNLEKLRSMNFSELEQNYQAENCTSFEDLLKREHSNNKIEKRIIRKEVADGWYCQAFSFIRNRTGDLKFIIGMMEDITRRRQAEFQIHEYQRKLQSLANELSMTEERERRSLAGVLHDHIGQILALAKRKVLDLSELVRYPSLPLVEDIRSLIEQSINYTRSLIFELSPPTLYEVGLEATLEWLGENMFTQHGLQVEVQNDGLPKPLNNEARVILFRSVRELLFNITKHADTMFARVSIWRADQRIHILVEDNGKGFHPPQNDAPDGIIKGFGLFSINERLTYLGGSMKIDSQPGRGARVLLEMPLEDEEKKKSLNETNRIAMPAPRPEHPNRPAKEVVIN